ncbi:venom serine carboxypeptidase-like [Leptidea sinapis]|uniref:venom serine carboxypeptidase-like n=1 Tax=Leptidea sinapis TaxID=189913 RepID=UPI002120DE98|nr:venom serine carboxypeptidase-like [Leptidea sinapis]
MFKILLYFVLIVSSCHCKVILEFMHKKVDSESPTVTNSSKITGNDEEKIFAQKDDSDNELDSNINKNKYIDININLPTHAPVSTDIIRNNNKTAKGDDSENEINNEVDVTTDAIIKENTVDNGTALILTPFIETDQIDEARNACKVDPTLFLGVNSYSGFFTVNKTYNSNVFFWYFPVENKPVNETPWIIWLQGGPGASSLTGLFDEIGPFRIDYIGTLKRNPYSWLQNHSLVFIDNPIGSGYSFTNNAEGFATDMSTYSDHLYSTVQQFLQVFPELRTAPLYIAGESYAGKYVPALGIMLHRNKNTSGKETNLKGLMMGNAFIDPDMLKNIVQPFYNFGLLDQEQLDMVNPLVTQFQEAIDSNNSIATNQKWQTLVSVLLILSHQKQAYNFLKDDLQIGRYVAFLKLSKIKRAIHVGDIPFSYINVTTNSKMAPDFLSSSKGILEELLEHYRVLTYCGHLDLMLSCTSAGKNHRTWKWSNSTDFHEATRYPYVFERKPAGYYKSGGGLTEVVVRGAGHMVPVDQPASAQSMVSRWIKEQPLSPFFNGIQSYIVKEYIKNNTQIYL